MSVQVAVFLVQCLGFGGGKTCLGHCAAGSGFAEGEVEVEIWCELGGGLGGAAEVQKC